jgi:heptosyltransferase III
MPRRASAAQRFADRYLGIPLVTLLGLLPKRQQPANPRRIGILKSSAIGDTLLLAGIPQAIHARYPAARVVLITGQDNRDAARFLTGVDEHVAIAPRSPLAALRTLRGLSLDILVECGPWPRLDALLTTLSGATYRVGFRVPAQARHFGFDRAIPHSSRRHQLENFRELFRAIGVTDFPTPSLSVSHTAGRDRLLSPSYVVFHPWSGGYLGRVKEWRSERWIDLARRIQRANPGTSIVLSGGPGDRERGAALAAELRANGVIVDDATARHSLAQLAPVLLTARAVVSVNTGIMHLAALSGAHTVSLEGPVPVHRWGPVGERVVSVTTSLPNCGYLDLGFEYSGQRLDCMDGVDVDRVFEAVQSAVEA